MTSSGCQRRAIVTGGSVAGLFLGNFPVRSGWQVDIFERGTDALIDRSAGIAGHPALTSALEVILGSHCHLSRIHIDERIAFDWFGRRLGALIELGLDDPTGSPRSDLTSDFILNESARLRRSAAIEGGQLPNLVH